MMVRNWNNTVSKHSNILHLGDVFLCPIEEAREYIKQLNGNKWLILGNHDTKSIALYEEMGFRVIGEPIFKEFDKYKIIFSHYPIRGLPSNFFNVHGHVHSKGVGPVPNPKSFYNVCVEQINYTPVQLSKIQSHVADVLRKQSRI
jgi:calcineurin-like phosphoesterase family protein